MVAVGIGLEHDGASYGWAVAVGGALVVAAGGVALWLRSRLPDGAP